MLENATAKVLKILVQLLFTVDKSIQLTEQLNKMIILTIIIPKERINPVVSVSYEPQE